MKRLLIILALLICPFSGHAQTTATGKVVVVNSANLPTTCSQGDLATTTDTGQFYECGSSNNWTTFLFMNGYVDCSQPQFKAADMSLTIINCLATLNAKNSVSGIADARGLAPGTLSVPILLNATTKPTGGYILFPGGTITTNVPQPLINDWGFIGLVPRSVDGQIGTVIKAGSSFPASAQNPGGTITFSGTGANVTVTGSGTSFTSSMVGCDIVAPSGEPRAANSTFGRIKTFTDNLHVTVGWAANNGTGYGGGSSSYDVVCPVIAMGVGQTTNAGAMFGMTLINIGTDSNNTTATGISNLYGQQFTYLQNVEARNFTGIGFDCEYQCQNFAGTNNITVSPGTSGTSGTIDIVLRANAQAMAPFQNVSASKGFSSINPSVCIDNQTNGLEFQQVDVEHCTYGISQGANTSCPVACMTPPRLTNGGHYVNVHNQSGDGTAAILLSNAFGSPDSVVMENIQISSGVGSTIVDQANSCTPSSSNNRLGFYALNKIGSIQYSTDNTAGCLSPPYQASLTTTNASSDNIAITGVTASSHCQLTPTNASAATNYTTTYVSAKTTNQITVTHATTSGMTYDVTCSAN